MRPLRAICVRFRDLFHKQRLDREFNNELAAHLDFHVADNLRAGMSPAEARRDALLRLGGVEQTKESHRDVRSFPFLESVAQDLRFGVRTLAKNLGFTAVAVCTLALGIGATAAIFGLVNGILLVSLPYRHPEQLVSVTGTYPKGAVIAMRQHVRSADVAAYHEGAEFNLTGQGEPVRLTGTLVSAELFSILGARAEVGRTFVTGEDDASQDRYFVLSHALWQQRFGGNSSIIGRYIELEGVSRQVVGVMPADFRFPSPRTQVWLPLDNDPRNPVLYWAGDFMPVLGRLHPGATVDQARAEIRTFQSRVGELFPWPMPASWNASVSVVPLQDGMVSDVRTRLLVLLAAVLFVVLIACANVANLTLARAATREKEVSVRAALGAVPRRIARQVLTESVLVAALGATLGILFATQGLALLKAWLPADTPRLAEAQVDWRVLLFTGTLTILTGLASGLAPALQSLKTSAAQALRAGGRDGSLPLSQRLRRALVIGEVASAVLLVIAAGLFIRSFWSLSHVNPGFEADRLITARLTPNQSFCADPERCVTFYRSLLQQLQAIPAVSSAAVVNTLPLTGRVAKRTFDLEGYVPPPGQNSPLFWLHAVSPDYFRVMNIPVVSGRDFADSDQAGAPVAVVSAATARRFWPDQNAVGKHLRLLGASDWRTVVGVVADVRSYDLQQDIPSWMAGVAYLPYNSAATLEDKRLPADMTLVLRTGADRSQIAKSLRETVAALYPEMPVSELKTMSAVLSDASATSRSTTLLFSIFAALALTLGAIGIYGVLSFLVSNRTREIGIRMAVGAQRRDVLWTVLKEGGKLSLSGIALGAAGAFLVTRGLSSQLYGVSATDPATFAAVPLVIAMVALLACYLPARRATRVDPMVALRYE